MKRSIPLCALILLAGCGSSPDAATAACQAQGLVPGTTAFAQCYATAADLPEDTSIQHETARQMIMGQ